MPNRPAALMELAIAIALSVAPAANAHRIAASGAGYCWDGELCFDTHLEGHSEDGIPGLDADFAITDTSVNSDNGHLSIAGRFSWVEGNTKPTIGTHFDDSIEEGAVLERIAPGPVTVRATLVLDGDGMIVSPNTSVRLFGSVGLTGGCGTTAIRTLYESLVTDWEPIGGGCAESDGSALVATATYDGALPTEPVVTARIQADLFGLYKGTVFDFVYGANLQLDLINATATWDTPTFLTAPEPEDDTLGLVALGAIAIPVRWQARWPRSRAAPSRSSVALEPAARRRST